MAKKVANALISNGKIERGYLGVFLADLTRDLKEIYKNKQGAFIMGVEPNSPAEKAGLKRGDLIVQVDGKKVKDANDLKNMIGDKLPGSSVKLKYETSSNDINSVKLKLANIDKKSSQKGDNQFLDGLVLQELDYNTRYQYQIPNNINGVLVLEVKEGTKAEKNGFQRGDIIMQINKTIIKKIADLNKALSKSKKSNNLVFAKRNGRDIPIVIK